MIRRPLTTLVALAVLLAPSEGLSEPVALPRDHTTVPAPGGTLSILERVYVVPEGTHLLTPPAWDRLDVETRRLQTVEVRLTAENSHMRTRLQSWQPGWRLLCIAAVVGLGGGIYLGVKL